VESLHAIWNGGVGLKHSSFEVFVTKKQQRVVTIMASKVLSAGGDPVLVLRSRLALSAGAGHARGRKELSWVVIVGVAAHHNLLDEVLVVVTFRNVLYVSEVLLAVLRTVDPASVALGEVVDAGFAVSVAARQQLRDAFSSVVWIIAPGTSQKAL
jgi:hypothetical protein